jgi:hypothetical protein
MKGMAVHFLAALLAFLLIGCGGKKFGSETEYLESRTKSLVAKAGVKQSFVKDNASFYLWELQSLQAIVDRVQVADGTVTILESIPFGSKADAEAWLKTEELRGTGSLSPVSRLRTSRVAALGAASSSLLASSASGPIYMYELPDGSAVVDLVSSDGLGGLTVTESKTFPSADAAREEFDEWTPNQLEWIESRGEELGASLDWARTLSDFQLYGWQSPAGGFTLDITGPDSAEGVELIRSVEFATIDDASAFVDSQLLDGTASWSGMLQFSKRGWMLIGTVIIVAFFIVFNVMRAQGAKTLTIRRIAGLDQIDEAIGRATETARPVLMVPGIGALDGISVQALTVFGSVIRSAARFATPIRLLTANPAVFGVAQEIARDVYLSEGVPEQFDSDSVRFVSDRQFAFASGVAGIIQRERVAAAFFMGEFYAESLIFAENANIVGAIQVAASTQTTQTPFFIAACDYVLLGDEFYAASAYLGRQPVLLGSLIGVDWAKMLFMAFVLGAVAIHSYNQLKPVDLQSLSAEERAVYQQSGQKHVDYRTDSWFLKLTKERRQ